MAKSAYFQGWGGNGIVENQEIPSDVVVTSAPEAMTTLRLTTAAPLRVSFPTLRPEVLPARGQIIHPASQDSTIAVDDSKFPVPLDYDLSSETPSLEKALNDDSSESSIPVLTAIQADSQPMELAVEREPLKDGVRLMNRRAIVVVPEDKDIEHEVGDSVMIALLCGERATYTLVHCKRICNLTNCKTYCLEIVLLVIE